MINKVRGAHRVGAGVGAGDITQGTALAVVELKAVGGHIHAPVVGAAVARPVADTTENSMVVNDVAVDVVQPCHTPGDASTAAGSAHLACSDALSAPNAEHTQPHTHLKLSDSAW